MVNSSSVSLVVNAAGPPAVTSVVPNQVNGASTSTVPVTIMFSGVADGTSVQIQGIGSPAGPQYYNSIVGAQYRVNPNPSGGIIIYVDAEWVGTTFFNVFISGGPEIGGVPFVVNA